MTWRIAKDSLDLLRRFPRPVWFRYRAESGQDTAEQVGWIAQDVEAVAPHLVAHNWHVPNDDMDYLAIRWPGIVAMLYNACIEMDARIQTLEVLLGATTKLPRDAGGDTDAGPAAVDCPAAPVSDADTAR